MSSTLSFAEDLIECLNEAEVSKNRDVEKHNEIQDSHRAGRLICKKFSCDEKTIGNECTTFTGDTHEPSAMSLIDECISIYETAKYTSRNMVDTKVLDDKVLSSRTEIETYLSEHLDNKLLPVSQQKIPKDEKNREETRSLNVKNQIFGNRSKEQDDILFRAAKNKLNRQYESKKIKKRKDNLTNNIAQTSKQSYLDCSNNEGHNEHSLENNFKEKSSERFGDSLVCHNNLECNNEKIAQDCFDEFLKDVKKFQETSNFPDNVHLSVGQRTAAFGKLLHEKYIIGILEKIEEVTPQTVKITEIIKSFVRKCMSVNDEKLEGYSNYESKCPSNERKDETNHLKKNMEIPKIIGEFSWNCFICDHRKQPMSRQNCKTCGRQRNYKGKQFHHLIRPGNENNTGAVLREHVEQEKIDEKSIDLKRRDYYLSRKLDHELDARNNMKTDITNLLSELRHDNVL